MQDVHAIIGAHPKSGSTRIRYMLAQYLNAVHGLGLGDELRIIQRMFPMFDRREAFAFRDVPLICFSHQPPSAHADVTCPKILLIRKPLDMIVSRYFHVLKHDPQIGDCSLYDFAMGRDGVEATAAFLNGCISHTGLVVTFEAMIEEPEATFKRTLAALSLPFVQSAFDLAMERGTFEYMSNAEVTHGALLPGAVFGEYDRDARRVRRGKVEGFRDYFAPGEVDCVWGGLVRLCSTEACEFMRIHDLMPEADAIEITSHGTFAGYRVRA